MSSTPALYKSAKLCKVFRYMECTRNKCDCKEGGGGGSFQRRKVRVACLDGGEIEREERGFMMWSYGIIADVQEMERAREGVQW